MRGIWRLKIYVKEGWARTTIFGKVKPRLDPIGRDANVRYIHMLLLNAFFCIGSIFL